LPDDRPKLGGAGSDAMDLRLTPIELAFRDEVRSFVKRALPGDVRSTLVAGQALGRQQIVDWQRTLNRQGWAVPHWPVEWGGTGWTPIQEYIWQEELQQAPAPAPLAFNVDMVGPVIATFGSEAQKKRFLPRAANLDDWWCQGFSETGAGSDLAALKTVARRDGDSYVVNGHKIWTTLAQHANWIFCLVRTDSAAKKQQGISFLLIDMTTPGITVRPIITIGGEHEINEVLLEDVRVPRENLVGEEHKGWDYAKFLLGRERTGIARVGGSKERIRRIKAIAAATRRNDATLLEDVGFRERLTAVEIELKALEITQLRVLTADRASGAEHAKPNPASSILKIKGSEIQQATTELLMELAGPYAMPVAADPNELDWLARVAPTYFNWRKVSIYGGSNEIQRNIIAKAILGL
jgi:pimeloyl-CoA dehydrogenase large subunit